MEILITNDDGIHSDGLKLLHNISKQFGSVKIVAPDRECSAMSHSLTLHQSLHSIRLNENKYTISGSPSDCVCYGIDKLFNKKLDLILSGINKGANLGEDISYSGTAGAAMEGTIHGYKSIAISLVDIGKGYNFNIIKNYIIDLLKKIINLDIPANSFLNINIPSSKNIKGVKFTFQDSRKYSGGITELKDITGKPYFLLGGGPPVWKNKKGSDYNAVINGYISITPIKLDLTDYKFLNILKKTI